MGPQLFYIDINDKLGDDVSDDDVDIDEECNCAPLQHVSVTGLVRDTVAQVTLVQSFVNPLKNATIEAAYHFPLYEGVAVCGFEAEVDGRKILGRVQERSKARKEFEGAVKAGKMASLMEQETPDVFQTSLGNVPPGKEIMIRITLVSEVKNDADENRIRFVLPTAIAPRYGEFPGPDRIPQADVVDHSNIFPNVPDVPNVPLDVASCSLSTKLSVNLSFAMSQPISSVQSPSHTIEVHLGATKTGEDAQYNPNCARVTLTADTFMDRDFVVVVNSPGVEEPKVLVERHPEYGTHAMALTFSPRFALSPIGSSELVFLVDRSGSMEGETIEQAGQALQLFLNSIPSDNLHYINIIGFGDTHQALFPRSVEYDASSLKQAMEYARSLRADMGGTEIASAFQEVLERRRKDIPTQIFALTDGEVWDVDSIVDTIHAAVEEGEKSGAFVRVFSLGVGDAVSHHTIEAIARAGDGYGQVVVEGERMEKKVVQLLKASLTPPITDLCVQWTDDNHSNDVRLNEQPEDAEFEFIEPDSWCGSDSDEDESTTPTKAPISLFGTLAPEEEPGTEAPQLPEIVTEVLQTPFRIPPPYRGARLTIAAILSSSIPVPEHIVLRGTSRDGPVELRVKVGPVVQHGEKLLHTLIARSLLRDLKEGSSYLSALIRKPPHDSKDGQMLKRLGIRLVKVANSSNHSIHPVSTAELVKRETIDIGLKHCLSSKYTSWIAIDECNRQLISFKPTEVQLAAQSYQFCNSAAPYSPPFNCNASNTEEDPDEHIRHMSAVTSKFALEDKWDDVEYFGCANPDENEALQEGWTTCDVTAGSGGGLPMLRGTKMFFPAYAREEDEGDAYSVSARATAASSGGGESPKSSIHFKLFGHHDATYNKSLTPAEQLLSLDPHLRLLAILQYQSFDGSFQLVSELGDLFHASVEEMEMALADLRTKLVHHEEPHADTSISDDDWRLVWATCLAVLYMQRELAQLQEEWELVVEKAERKVELLLQKNKDVVAMAKHAALEFAELHTRS